MQSEVITMAKYGPKAHELVEREMKEMKAGKLRSGSGEKVTNPKQAIAIALSEARRSGTKIPAPPPGTASADKAPSDNRAARKAAAKRAPAKKAMPKKTAAKAAPKKAAAGKAAAKKSETTEAAPTKKSSASRKSTSKKATTGRAAKKSSSS